MKPNAQSQAVKTNAKPARRSAHELERIRQEVLEPRAQSAHYDAAANCMVVVLKNGVTLTIPTGLIEGLENADPQLIARVEMDKRGLVLNWEELHAGITIPDLLSGCFGSARWMDELRARSEAPAAPTASEMGRKGGKARNDVKAAAARANGKLGGRPRRKVTA